MLQIRNDLEIIEQLRKEPKHIRAVATNLKLIPSTVMRTMKQLEKENVVDYTLEGKNKKYSLKQTIEAKSYLIMCEQYKLIKSSYNPKLRKITKEITAQTNGELIVLFGSYAKETESKESDIDIYIETENKELKENLRKISEKLSIKIGKLDKEDSLTKEMVKNHVILQNAERFYQIIK